MDLLVIAACCMVFAAVIGAARSVTPKAPPVAVSGYNLRTAPHGPRTEDDQRLVATALGIFAEAANSVLE